MKICENCKKQFVTNTWGRNTRFCSKSCASKLSNKSKKKTRSD